MQIKFLQNRIGEIYDGVVSVTEWGLYIEIISNKWEGLVKISSLKDDHYFYSEKIRSNWISDKKKLPNRQKSQNKNNKS